MILIEALMLGMFVGALVGIVYYLVQMFGR
jgi:hypothetical protein